MALYLLSLISLCLFYLFILFLDIDYLLILQEPAKEQIPTDISDFIEKIVHDEEDVEEEVRKNDRFI